MAPADTAFYDLLEVSPEATAEELNSAYKKRALKLHPDKPGGNAEQFKAMKAAYDVLKDPSKRQLYDRHGPAFVRFIDGDTEAMMEVALAFLTTASKIVLCSLPVVSALVFFPAVVFSLRWDGKITWHWAVAFIPAWTFQLVFVLFLLWMRSLISMLADAVSEEFEKDEEEDRAAKEESQRRLRSTLSLGICIIVMIMIQEAVFAMRLQGSISGSWFLIALPYFILEFFYISVRVYSTKLLISAESPIMVFMFPVFLWLLVRLATVALLAAKADELLEITWLLALTPLFVAASVRMIWSCYLSAKESPRTVDADGEASEKKGAGNVVGTFCFLTFWVVIVMLAALKMDGRKYSAFYVFAPYFIFGTFALCCCACLACCGPLLMKAAMMVDQEESPNPQGTNGSTPLINPQQGATSYQTLQSQTDVAKMA
jgi:curved DNA-binding protein CbpA|mmetsp:Transcript_10548/g.17243  ORF Transcript_10548/g.17243 Transcript_10548/m.17243 type:complete len:429 (-) Transcript_10548:64-1350(-)